MITERLIYPNSISLSQGDRGALFDTQQSYLRHFCNKIDFLGKLWPISGQLAEMLKLWNLPHSGILFRGQFRTIINHQRLYIVDMGGFGHRVNSDSIRNGGVIWIKAIPFRKQSCLHKSPENSAINKLNFTLKILFFEADSPTWLFCFLAHMLFWGPT